MKEKIKVTLKRILMFNNILTSDPRFLEIVTLLITYFIK